MKKDITLNLIITDAGTQQRPLDEDAVRLYTALMLDGVEFPPVEVVSDGTNYWLTDGFHRYYCAEELGRKTIEVDVVEGTLRDAIWRSFGANRDHGLPRQRGVAKKIVEEVFADSTWAKKSLNAIARHVGVTRQYVTKIRDEFEQAKVSTNAPFEDAKPYSEPKNSEKGATSCSLLRSDQIEVKSSRGKTYKQRSQEKQHKADEPETLTDSVGREIPEHLRQIWQDRSIFRKLLNDLGQIKVGVQKHLDSGNPVFALLNGSAFQMEYGNLQRLLKFAMPYAVCVYCGGDATDCKACKGFGFLNKISYDNAPRELKP